MARRIYVLQHGNAVSKEEDEARPISSEGRRDIERVAAHLAEKHVLLDQVVSSKKLRAMQTANIVSGMLALNTEPQAVDGLSPNDDPQRFIDQSGISEGTVLVVSHMPFVSSLCSILLTGKPDVRFAFTPGTLACVDYADGQWSLLSMVSPGDL